MDGGTLGGWLLDEILSTRRMLVFDCCDFKEKPGTLKVLKKSDVKIWSSTKISPHQTGFNDLLASAAILGYELEDLAVVGIQPELLDDYGGSLSPLIRSRLDEAVELGAKFLEEWGVKLTPHPAGTKVTPLSFSVLELNEYEAGVRMPRKLAVSAMNASLCGRRGTQWKTPKKQNNEESRNIRCFLWLGAFGEFGKRKRRKCALRCR